MITCLQHRSDIQVTKAMCGADCWTDHCLLIAKVMMHISRTPRPQGKNILRHLDVQKPAAASISHLPTEELERHSEDIMALDSFPTMQEL